jgi:hypothetical protein
VANGKDDIISGTLFRVTQVMFGKLSEKCSIDGKSITEHLCTMWRMIMTKLLAAHSSELFRFGLENYHDNSIMTAALSHRFAFGISQRKTWQEESLAHVANDNDNFTSSTLIRVSYVWFGNYLKMHG